MDTAVIPMLINSDFMEIPLDKRLDLADYKMYGEKSHVFQNKDRLHSLCECTGLTMNDLTINTETLEYFVKKNKTGYAFAAVYGIEHREVFEKLSTLEAVIGSEAAMTAVLNNSTAMTAVLNSSTAMTAVANSSTAMTTILNSSKCMLLKDTGLSGAEGGTCYGKFLLVGSTTLNPCVDKCIPDYISQIQTQYKLTLSTTKFGTVYTKIGVPGVPVTTIFTMLDDYSSGVHCVVYKL